MLSLITTSLTFAALAADPNSAHPHAATLTPITSAPAGVALTASEISELQDGDPVLRQSSGDDGGSGTAIQYIEATPEVIWQTILNYPMYGDWVKGCVSATVYKNEGDVLYVDMQNSILGIKSGLYTRNEVHKSQGYMAWTLDRSRTSDVKDMVGYWRVESVQADPPISKLEYSTELTVSGVPDFLVRYLTRDSLVDGTEWVKERAEAASQ